MPTNLVYAEGNNSILVSIEVAIDLQSSIESFVYFFTYFVLHHPQNDVYSQIKEPFRSVVEYGFKSAN